MSLPGLPTELLVHIISATTPRGYEALLLSCKTAYEAGKSFLERHNALRRRYRHFAYDEEIKCSFQLLHRIANDPIIAEYIEHADFLQDEWPEELAQHGVETWPTCLNDETAVDAIANLLKNSRYLKRADIDPGDWLDAEKMSVELQMICTILRSSYCSFY